jgi:hypothetical protein
LGSTNGHTKWHTIGRTNASSPENNSRPAMFHGKAKNFAAVRKIFAALQKNLTASQKCFTVGHYYQVSPVVLLLVRLTFGKMMMIIR